MEKNETNNKFNWQSFISIGLLMSFIVMFVSGVVLYIAPEGSLSRWIGWDVLNLTKKQWEHQHTIFSYLFILFSVFHIFKINWGYLLSYFIVEKLKISNLREILIAIIITVFVFTGTLFNINPFKYVIQLESEISEKHSENVEMPNIPDAEKLTLKEFSEKVLNIDYSILKSKLGELDLEGVDENILVNDFCKLNDLTPEELYKILKGEFLLHNFGAPDFTSFSSFFMDKNTIL